MKFYWILIIIAVVILFGPAILKYVGLILNWISKGCTFLHKVITATGYTGLLG